MIIISICSVLILITVTTKVRLISLKWFDSGEQLGEVVKI